MRLSAIDLACHRGGRDVFAGVSFRVASGEALTITGRNGAGKSSLLRTIVGLVRVASGKLALEGGDPELTIAEQAHYLGHQDALKPSLSVIENLRFWTGFLGAGPADTHDALDAVGLDELADLPAAYLSAGQRRRLSIARLLAIKRPIWLLDEPTSTLDASAQQRLVVLMQAHLAGGGLILAASHVPIGLGATQELRIEAPLRSPVPGEGFGGRLQDGAAASMEPASMKSASMKPAAMEMARLGTSAPALPPSGAAKQQKP